MLVLAMMEGDGAPSFGAVVLVAMTAVALVRHFRRWCR
jgi:hypothetical protein